MSNPDMVARAGSKSEQVRELLKAGMPAAEIAKKVGCTTGLVYNVRSRLGQAGQRGLGLPRKAAVATPDGLDGLLAAVKDSDRQRGEIRAALERIQAVVDGALG